MQCLPRQLVDVLPAVGGAFLTLLHLVFSLFQTLHKYFVVLKFKWLERTVHKQLKSVVEEAELVSSQAKQLRQVPHHLVVILGTETIALKDLANLVVWSLAAGVTFISFYDYQGSIRKYKDQLDQAVQAAIGKKVSFFIKNGFKITHKNGSSKQMPCVSILDMSDGKELIVNAVRKLCADARNGLATSGGPTQDELDQILIKESGLPEAQLAIYLGSICCLYGFMPWHARITEFLPLQDAHNINVTEFLSILRKYNKCEQRFGK